MKDLETLKTRLEYIFLKELAALIRDDKDKEISNEDTKKWAQTFLSIEPFNSPEDAQQKVNGFCTTYPQFSRLKEYLDSYIKEEHIDVTLDKMREKIKANDIDGAIAHAKGEN